MGSKNKTVRSLGYSKLLPEDKDLFIENIVRTVASAKSINPLIINNALLRVNRYYGFEAFKKLDSAVEVTGKLVEFDIKKLYATLGLSCTEDKPLNISTSSAISDKFLYRIGGFSSGTCKGNELFETQYTYENFIELADGRLTGDKYSCDAVNDTKTFIETITVPGVDEDIIVIDIENKSGSIAIQRRYRAIRSAANKTSDLDSLTFLSATYKSNFIKNKGKTLKAFNSIMGIPNKTPKTRKKDCTNWDDATNTCLDDNDSFEDTLNNPDYKHIFMTYCVPYEEPYKDIIDSIYSNNANIELNFHGITVSTGYNNALSGVSSDPANPNYCDGTVASGSYAFMVDGVAMQTSGADEKPQYLIPMEVFRLRRDLREKHDDIGNALTLVVMAEKTVKVKWYQTGFFRILTWIVAIVFAVYGNPQMLIGMITSTILTAVLGDTLSAVVNILTAIYTLGTSIANSAISIMNIITKVVDIASNIMSMYFKASIENIQDKIKDIADKAEETQEAINEIARDMIYIPFGDALETIYSVMYDLMYNGAYQMSYNYDRLISVEHMYKMK